MIWEEKGEGQSAQQWGTKHNDIGPHHSNMEYRMIGSMVSESSTNKWHGLQARVGCWFEQVQAKYVLNWGKFQVLVGCPKADRRKIWEGQQGDILGWKLSWNYIRNTIFLGYSNELSNLAEIFSEEVEVDDNTTGIVLVEAKSLKVIGVTRIFFTESKKVDSSAIFRT